MILKKLNSRDDRPWGEWRGKKLTAIQLAALLRPFGVSSKTIRVSSSQTRKGYLLADLAETFRRYLPPETRNSRNTPDKIGIPRPGKQ